MNMKAAYVGDIYRGPDGAIYKVLWTCDEPTVGVVSLVNTRENNVPSFVQSGGITGLMWEGFERIYNQKGE